MLPKHCNALCETLHQRGIGGYRYVCSLYVWQKLNWTSLNLLLTKVNGDFYLRILWNWEVCWCAVLRNSESQVGCLGVQCTLFVGEMTNTLRAISCLTLAPPSPVLWLVVEFAPVVHEYVWFPKSAGRHPYVFHVPVLGRVPFQVGVRPLLPRQSSSPNTNI